MQEQCNSLLTQDRIMEAFDIPVTHRMVLILSNSRRLHADLLLPAEARGLVIFVHPQRGGRMSPRIQRLARSLQDRRFAALLVDLLEESEMDDRSTPFNIAVLAMRLQSAIEWVRADADTSTLPVGYFGAGTGTAAAMSATAGSREKICPLVSIEGRPDLAWTDLPKVVGPALLLVGAEDEALLELNRRAFEKMTCLRELLLIQGEAGTHSLLGASEEAAKLMTSWFEKYLSPTLNLSQ